MRVLLPLAAVVLLTGATAPVLAGADGHVLLAGRASMLCSGAESEVVIDVVEKPTGGFVATLLSSDLCWALFHVVGAPFLTTTTLSYQLSGSWETGLVGRQTGPGTFCQSWMALGPYGNGASIDLQLFVQGNLSLCGDVWRGSLHDTALV